MIVLARTLAALNRAHETRAVALSGLESNSGATANAMHRGGGFH